MGDEEIFGRGWMTAGDIVNMGQHLKGRPFEGDDDFWLVRNLLIETYPLTPTGFNWEIRRWDGWRHHLADTHWRALVHLWFTEDDVLVGTAHPEYGGDAYLELHPDYRHVEEEMIAWAEGHLASQAEGAGRHLLSIFAFEYDSPRCHLLEKRDYVKTSNWGVTRRLRLGHRPIPQPTLAEGYVIRSTRPDHDEYQKIADVLNAGFGRVRHTAEEFVAFVSTSPSYRHDLNLIAEAADGSFASLVGVTYDEANRRGIFEPVCTHPDHRRKGLARALMYEGLRRLKALDATDAYVETGEDVAANQLYEAVGFTEAYKGYVWKKELE
jgi:mycothiol synthase